MLLTALSKNKRKYKLKLWDQLIINKFSKDIRIDKDQIKNILENNLQKNICYKCI